MAIRILENPLSSKNIGFRIEVKIRTPFKEEEPDQPYCYFFIIYVGLYGRGFPLRGSGVPVFTTNQIMGRDFCAGNCPDSGHKCTSRIHASQLPNFQKWPSSADWTNTLVDQCYSIGITKDKKG